MTTTDPFHRPFPGPTVEADGRTTFRLFAPAAKEVAVVWSDGLPDTPLRRIGDGWFVGSADDAAGRDYRIRLDDHSEIPDPGSRFQPDGVHGPSRVVDHRFEWTDRDWTGVPRRDWVIYEMHVGCFTEGGTYSSAIDRLDELVRLGVTVIELMPLAQAAGRWNWGYDGVGFYAPNHAMGTPDDLRRLVDAAHARGLAVIHDVVYNHFGPEGNYLHAPGGYVSPTHRTVWGDAPNFDGEHSDGCRRFFVDNAVYWLDHFHFDGVRVDAIHCMRDDSERHVAIELAEAVAAYRRRTGRPGVLIAEANVHNPDMLRPIAEGGVGFDAAWMDDFLHSAHAVVRPGEQLSHRIYRPTDLDQVLRCGFVHTETFDTSRGRVDEPDPIAVSGAIICIQNHDFIGNHPLGRRLHHLTDVGTQASLAALMMMSPSIPMIFMGEEFACEHPFGFFVDFGDEGLRTAVVEGRRREYPQHDWSGGVSPLDEKAFTQSKIGEIGNRRLWDAYRGLINLRRRGLEAGWLDQSLMTVANDVEAGMYSLAYAHDGRLHGVTASLLGRPIDVGDGRTILWDTRSIDDGAATNRAVIWERGSSSISM